MTRHSVVSVITLEEAPGPGNLSSVVGHKGWMDTLEEAPGPGSSYNMLSGLQKL